MGPVGAGSARPCMGTACQAGRAHCQTHMMCKQCDWVQEVQQHGGGGGRPEGHIQRDQCRESSLTTPGGRPKVMQCAIPWGSASRYHLLSKQSFEKSLTIAWISNVPIPLRAVWAQLAILVSYLLLSTLSPLLWLQWSPSDSQNMTLGPSQCPHLSSSLPNKLPLGQPICPLCYSSILGHLEPVTVSYGLKVKRAVLDSTVSSRNQKAGDTQSPG